MQILLTKPVVINMSFGTGLGPHDGTTLEEQAINNLSNTPGLVLVAAHWKRWGQKTRNKCVQWKSNKILLNNKNIYSTNEKSTIDIWSINPRC